MCVACATEAGQLGSCTANKDVQNCNAAVVEFVIVTYTQTQKPKEKEILQ